ncbi:hypothetical protein CcaverHIS002_0309110 [Cutaneotrichosporon cavernicola]|uniref:Uncharacterized protein n=1 Tax=Cutaneotrichosporon cavernicola TaxID=279322 RepID=A0AA48ID96_9TREE|nr:uncharacterized protein CcaverHIS019_0308970 [Cutaneotrichosporon cavernicola]BEI83043.1 hypothetical protein CcaverHIS002_0309110 [Cutaneotrichosporon cavernicola]BEI90827.1 hypothetical protein CcaverHIS019_0308970 [Cutaneotrichosporon cavernicola]BEI98606.1 hypothetical protein CcaverHIS631_0309050 [Cutaneotrichosporon cavernicola]BEJ06375.1 hypothetical protein CcaverHIS641_0308970 [Cutaneotrichosporon cavernicola]
MTALRDSGSTPALTKLSYLVISGGTGANSFASAFGPSPAYVLPVSDDGGSSAEILRCFGGPSIGDIRSRLIRLIPQPSEPVTREDRERRAIYNLMAHRFPSTVAEKIAREGWEEIVEGRSALWNDVGEDKRECIRAFLVHFQTLCLRRAHKRFSFRNFSLGNGFLTGARDLFSSLPSAIFLFKSVAGVNEGVQVIPVINTNQTITIAASLANGDKIIGQCNISHPAPPPPIQPLTRLNSRGVLVGPRPSSSNHLRPPRRRDSRTFDTVDSAQPSPSRGATPLPLQDVDDDEAFGRGNIGYMKGMEEVPLESRIERLFYINLYGQEIFPEPNGELFEALDKRDVLVYSCGSLWTSIIPCLALRNLASSIALSKSLKAKVMLLNSVNDRETPGYTAMDYIDTIANMLRHYDVPVPLQNRDDMILWETSSFITHVAYLEGGKVEVDEQAITARGIKLIRIPSELHCTPKDKTPLFNAMTVEWTMEQVVSML